MSSESFIRKSSGLVRAASLRDVLIYNIYFTSFFLAVVFVYIIGFNAAPQGDMITGVLLCTGLCIFQVLTYAFMAAAMPRSGGDYVYVSRLIHPALGFATSWNWVFWLCFWIGFGGYNMAQIGVSGLLSTLGYATHSAGLLAAGGVVTHPVWTFIIGTITIAAFTVMISVGLKMYFKIQLVTFVLAIIGTAVALIAVGTMSHADFIAQFNQTIAAAGGTKDAYQSVISAAQAAHWHAGGKSVFWQSLLIIPAAYTAIPWVMGSTFISAEVRDVQRNQIWGTLLALLFVGLLTAVIAAVMFHTEGSAFLSSLSYLFFNDPSKVPVAPYFNDLLFILIKNPILNVLASIGFILMGWMFMAQNALINTRVMLAWSLDRMAPESWADVHPTYKTPVKSTLVVMLVAELFLAVLSFSSILQVLSSMWAISLSVLLVGVAAVIFPYVKKDLFEASGVKWRVLGIPVVTIFGAITIVFNLFIDWAFLKYPVYGVNSVPSELLVAGIFIAGIVYYYAYRSSSKKQGFNVDLAFKEIPPV